MFPPFKLLKMYLHCKFLNTGLLSQRIHVYVVLLNIARFPFVLFFKKLMQV